MNIKVLNPFRDCPTIKNFDANEEFGKLSARGKAVTLLATGIISILTVFLGSKSYFKMLVGRLRHLESLSGTGEKANDVGIITLRKPANAVAEPETPENTLNETRTKTSPITEKKSESAETPLSTAANTKEESTVTPQNPNAESKAETNDVDAANSAKTERVSSSMIEYENNSRDFWEVYFGHEENRRILQMTFNNFRSEDKDVVVLKESAVDFLLTHYDKYQRSINPGFQLYPELKDELLKQFDFGRASGPGLETSDTGNRIRIYETLGDGTCGLHALLGVERDGVVQGDAKKMRKTFCDWLRAHAHEYQVRELLGPILTDYFLYFDGSPSGFRGQIQKLHEELFSQYTENGHGVEEFITHPEVLEAYLANLEKVDTYLLQEELEAAAICFKKRVILYQPGWGEDANIGETVLNPEGETEVRIWYNGHSHYERAELLPPE